EGRRHHHADRRGADTGHSGQQHIREERLPIGGNAFTGHRRSRVPRRSVEEKMGKIVLSAILALSFSTSLSHAQSTWTGGDDLPTNPLACDGTPATAEAVPYDGGEPTDAPDRKGKTLTVVDVPKLVGIGYFNA